MVRWTALALVFVLWQAAGGEQYAGIWTGTYDGSGAGTFEMALDKGKDGAITGKVNVNGDGATYAADLKLVAFDGAKMTATYDFPPDPSAEIVMTTTFESGSATGTWSLRPKGQNDEIASGGIAVTEKQEAACDRTSRAAPDGSRSSATRVR